MPSSRDSARPRPRRTRRPTRALACALLLGLVGCSSGTLPGVYRIDIQQGNIVTPEMLSEVEIGMDKRQVRFLLGTPLVADAFHQDRWDYVYSYHKRGGKRVQQHVSLHFDDRDRLARIEGALDPGMEYHTVVDARETVITVPRKRERGFFGKLVPAFMRSDDYEEVPEPAAQDEGAAAPAEASAGTDEARGEALELSETYAPNVASDAVEQEDAAGARDDTRAQAPSPGESEFLEELFEGYGRGPGDTGR